MCKKWKWQRHFFLFGKDRNKEDVSHLIYFLNWNFEEDNKRWVAHVYSTLRFYAFPYNAILDTTLNEEVERWLSFLYHSSSIIFLRKFCQQTTILSVSFFCFFCYRVLLLFIFFPLTWCWWWSDIFTFTSQVTRKQYPLSYEWDRKLSHSIEIHLL